MENVKKQIICYDLVKSSLCNIKCHPREDIENLGGKILKWEEASLIDSIFMEVENLPENLPDYITFTRQDFEFADILYKKSLIRVETTLPPINQKFSPGTLVKINDRMLFENNCRTNYGVVEYTYAHAYGGDNIKSYCLLVRYNKNKWFSRAWFQEDELTEIVEEEILQELEQELKNIKINE